MRHAIVFIEDRAEATEVRVKPRGLDGAPRLEHRRERIERRVDGPDSVAGDFGHAAHALVGHAQQVDEAGDRGGLGGLRGLGLRPGGAAAAG
jgi:hypothetical protein